MKSRARAKIASRARASSAVAEARQDSASRRWRKMALRDANVPPHQRHRCAPGGAVDGSFEGFEATGWALARRAVHRGEVSADGGAWSAATRAARRTRGSCRCIAQSGL